MRIAASHTLLLIGAELDQHAFPEGHPNSIDRQSAFWSEAQKQGLDDSVRIGTPRQATREELLRFHDERHVEQVGTCSRRGTGYLDDGDTPALNIPLLPGADDGAFFAAWERVEAHLARHRPEFLILQCGADGLAGDPLADLRLSPAAHAHATRRLVTLAEEHSQGRVMVFGGGGYDAGNVAAAWTETLRALLGVESGIHEAVAR